MTSIFRSLGLLVVLSANAGLAQFRPQNEDMQLHAGSIYFEAIPLFGEDTSKAFVNLHYRISKNFFVFVRNANNREKEEYAALGELAVELLNEAGVSAGREIRKIALTRSSLPKENELLGDIQGSIAFVLPAGTFNIVFEVDDRESGRHYIDRKQKVATRPPKLKPLEVSAPFFVQMVSPTSDGRVHSFHALNRGLDLLYGSKGGYVMEVFLPAADLQTHWTLERVRDRDDRFFEKQEFSGGPYTMVDGLLRLHADEAEVLYRPAETALPWKVLFVQLPLEKLEPGTFELHLNLTSGSSTGEVKRTFRVYWPNKPMSLSNFDLAVDALRHIAKEEDIADMIGLSASNGMKKFQEFWKKKDPDTTTAYNEVMVEYYRRVDEAIKRYSSSKENDGYKTDRGRIFIIYGSPTKIERLLLPNTTPTEIWTYDHLKRRFAFADPTRIGNFVLSRADTL